MDHTLLALYIAQVLSSPDGGHYIRESTLTIDAFHHHKRQLSVTLADFDFNDFEEWCNVRREALEALAKDKAEAEKFAQLAEAMQAEDKANSQFETILAKAKTLVEPDRIKPNTSSHV